MAFEFDAAKSAANKAKHGIDFEEAQALWQDLSLIEVPVPTTDEPRWLVVARIDTVHWSAIITYRGDNVRVISVRRARKGEVERYEGK